MTTLEKLIRKRRSYEIYETLLLVISFALYVVSIWHL